MENKPRLYNDPTKAVCGRGEFLEEIEIPISPDGGYNGNGEFQEPEGKVFKILSAGIDSWTGRAYVIRRIEKTIY